MRVRHTALAVMIAVALTAAVGLLAYRTRPGPTASAKHSVADVFRRPPIRPPGYPWTRDGRPVPTDVVDAHAGSGRHCGWQSATLLNLGFGSPDGAGRRQYIRDPKGVVQPRMERRVVLRAALPADAVDTGLRTRGVELWLARDESTAYLVNSAVRSDVEAWPRAPVPTGCD